MEQINNSDINIKYADVIKNIRKKLEEAGREFLLEHVPYRTKVKHDKLKAELDKEIEKCCEVKSYKVSKLKLPRKLKKKFKKQCCYSYKIDVLLNNSICDTIEGKVTVE